MSQANVEVVKRAFDAFDPPDVDILAEVTTWDFEWFPALPGSVGGGSYRGREGIEKYFEDVLDTWEEFRVLAEEFRDLGDRVLTFGRVQVRGRGSGVPVDTPLGVIFDFRDGRISRSCTYLDHGEALRAAGLSE
jgi:ketosteroid isomerase-like protein